MNQNLPTAGDQQQLTHMMMVANLQRQVKNGASNFFWIAGLSLINSLIQRFGGGITFVVGLGVAQFVDGFSYAAAKNFPNATFAINSIGLLINLGFAGMFVIFGIFAAKGRRWAFITGMVLYALDAVLVLAFKDFFGFAFHLFFLWLLFNGFRALQKLGKTVPQTVSDPAFPINIGS
jgi:hypothetical protein